MYSYSATNADLTEKSHPFCENDANMSPLQLKNERSEMQLSTREIMKLYDDIVENAQRLAAEPIEVQRPEDKRRLLQVELESLKQRVEETAHAKARSIQQFDDELNRLRRNIESLKNDLARMRPERSGEVKTVGKRKSDTLEGATKPTTAVEKKPRTKKNAKS